MCIRDRCSQSRRVDPIRVADIRHGKGSRSVHRGLAILPDRRPSQGKAMQRIHCKTSRRKPIKP